MNSYNEGQRIKCTVHFRNADTGASVDPTTVRFCTEDPEGKSNCYTYGIDVALTRTSLGHYRYDLLLSKHGIWNYGWFGSGNYDGTALAQVYACELPVSTWPTS